MIATLCGVGLLAGCSRSKPGPAPFVIRSKPVVAAESPEQGCRKFVQNFYDGYVRKCWPRSQPEACSGAGAAENALNFGAGSFSPELNKWLREDVAAEENTDFIVGLDWDPIVAGQDIDGVFQVRSVTRKGDHYFADVYEIQPGENPTQPHIVAELTQTGQHWQFVNFHYAPSEFPEQDDLLGQLKELRNQRSNNVRKLNTTKKALDRSVPRP